MIVRIGHELKDVEIQKYETTAAALRAGMGSDYLKRPSNRLADRLLPKKHEEVSEDMEEFLLYPLIGKYEDPQPYRKTLALAFPEREIRVHNFYEELSLSKYYPANIHESVSYLARIPAGVTIDVVFHLGERFLDSALQERRLLTRRSDGLEFLPFYPRATRLKSHYCVVVVKEDEKIKPH